VTSPLPPKRRDTRGVADLLRQDRVRLSQLDRGLVGGRAPNLRPLPPGLDSGESDEDDETPDFAILFENTDTGTCWTDGANVRIRLTHEPLDGSEQVYWRGIAIPRADWYRTDTLLTVPGLPFFKAGDGFWVDYAYEEDNTEVGPLEALTFRDSVTGINMPGLTQVGDLIVVGFVWRAGQSAPINHDPRVSPIAAGPQSIVYVGIAADLSPLDMVYPVNFACKIAAFAGAATVQTSATATGTASSVTSPAVASNAAIAVLMSARPIFAGQGPGSSNIPTPPWSDAGATAVNYEQVTIAYWFDSNPAATSPVSTCSFSGGIVFDEATVTVLGMEGAI
jgi:hypothetical protein